MTYLVDSNVLIEAKNRHYPLDVVPAFWDWIKAGHAKGLVYSVPEVRDEIEAGKDELSSWIKSLPRSFWRPTTTGVVGSLSTVASWVTSEPRWAQAAKDEFLDAADYPLIAHALADGLTVVTHENGLGAIKRVKIPDVCDHFRVGYTLPWTMLRAESARFVLP